jgi:hypothetical protein
MTLEDEGRVVKFLIRDRDAKFVGPDKELAALPLTRHDFHGDWNYTLTPATA